MGNINHLDNMKFDNFDYGRYIKSSGYEGLIDIVIMKYIRVNKFL